MTLRFVTINIDNNHPCTKNVCRYFCVNIVKGIENIPQANNNGHFGGKRKS